MDYRPKARPMGALTYDGPNLHRFRSQCLTAVILCSPLTVPHFPFFIFLYYLEIRKYIFLSEICLETRENVHEVQK
jgi:hypothetical protein